MWTVLLLSAGTETTANLIGGGMRELMRNPDATAKLLADPELLRPAVSEMLRCVTPGRYIRRTVMTDTELCGQPLKAGDAVIMNFTVANADPHRFPDPFRFDVERHPCRLAGVRRRRAPLRRAQPRAPGGCGRLRGTAGALPQHHREGRRGHQADARHHMDRITARALRLTVVAVLLAAAPAHAAPFTIAKGFGFSIAAAPDGTAYAVTFDRAG